MSAARLPVAVVGAGPVGLAAAAHLIERGESPLILEAGPTAGASILVWGHVRLFSPWRYLVDRAAAALLEPTGWTVADPEALPTGRELVERYLAPLADHPAIRPHLRLGTRVVSVSRRGLDKMKSPGREAAPFVLRVEDAGGEREVLARAVIDASGTYLSPNPLGAGGTPALGERRLIDRIFYGIPDVLGRDRARYAGRRVLVVGSGHSAFNALLDLSNLAREAPGTEITWLVRRTEVGPLFGGGRADALPARGELGERVRDVVGGRGVRQVSARLAALERTPDGVAARDETGARVALVDEIVAVTGFRPDLTITRELRLDLDELVEAPRALAPLIDPNVHSCGTVPPHGAAELAHPEPGFYVVGMKSYGRAPTFLMLTGYEQVRSVVAALAGDMEAARRVELVLPETGVCSAAPIAGEASAGGASAACCGAAPADGLVTLGTIRK